MRWGWGGAVMGVICRHFGYGTCMHHSKVKLVYFETRTLFMNAWTRRCSLTMRVCTVSRDTTCDSVSADTTNEDSVEHYNVEVWKAQYCRICKDFCPIASFIRQTDDNEGGSKKEKTMRSNICNKHNNEIQEQQRFCKKCNALSTVSNFPPGEETYTCKADKYLRADKEADKCHCDDPTQNRKMRSLRLCYKDRVKFKQTRVDLKPKDVEILILKIDPTLQNVYALVPKIPRSSWTCKISQSSRTATERPCWNSLQTKTNKNTPKCCSASLFWTRPLQAKTSPKGNPPGTHE